MPQSGCTQMQLRRQPSSQIKMQTQSSRGACRSSVSSLWWPWSQSAYRLTGVVMHVRSAFTKGPHRYQQTTTLNSLMRMPSSEATRDACQGQRIVAVNRNETPSWKTRTNFVAQHMFHDVS